MSTFYKGTAGDYTIKKGDNLSTIAKNAGVTVNDIAKWNGIEDVNKIGAGAKLYTKNPNTATPVAAAASAPIPEPEATNVVTTINGNKTINENDLYKTGADFESTVPTSTDEMKKDGISYTWEKEGKIQGFLETQIQSEQVKREALEAKGKLNVAAINDANGKAEVVSNQNQNKMGITGRAQADMDRSVSVAKNARALDLYTQEEMIKNGYETGVKIAAMYGDLKEREVTLAEYEKAVSRADAEASMTGYYFDPVQMQLLSQANTATSVLGNVNATPDEKARATKILTGIDDAFIELGITKAGRETITSIHQKAMEELSQQANDIATAQVNLAKRTLKADVNNDIVERATNMTNPTDDNLRALIKSYDDLGIYTGMTVAELRTIISKELAK